MLPRSLLLFITIVACTPISRQTGTFAPNTPGYAYRDGVVLRDNAPLYRVVQHDIDRLTTTYDIQSTDGTSLAMVTFASSYQNTLECRAQFAGLGVHYEVRLPIVPFTQLLASYIDNGVLADGQVNRDGLAAYAASRGFAVVDTAAQLQRLQEAGRRSDCRRCVEDFRRCQVEASYRRQHPRPGVSVTQSCETGYQECSQGGILTRRDEWPCGAPPA
jgi:hypothetical protein